MLKRFMLKDDDNKIHGGIQFRYWQENCLITIPKGRKILHLEITNCDIKLRSKKGEMMSEEVVPAVAIESMIFLIRGQKVMLDKDLAALYGVVTKSLKRSVKRNIKRFPQDFMFILNGSEMEALGCHFGTPVQHLFGGYAPYAFTEYGILMLSSVLNSPRAIDVNIQIMRTFARLRQMIAGNKELSGKLEQLEKRVLRHDSDIRELVREIRKLAIGKSSSKLKVGFLK